MVLYLQQNGQFDDETCSFRMAWPLHLPVVGTIFLFILSTSGSTINALCDRESVCVWVEYVWVECVWVECVRVECVWVECGTGVNQRVTCYKSEARHILVQLKSVRVYSMDACIYVRVRAYTRTVACAYTRTVACARECARACMRVCVCMCVYICACVRARE